MKLVENLEHYITRDFMIYRSHLIFLGSQIQRH